jgi:lipoate-protein ligase B
LTTCHIVDLGLVHYAEAWELQKRVAEARKAGAIGDVLLLCEHPHVITLGRNGRREHLLASEHVLRQMNVEFFPTNRGGDITYHGPGQIIGYPVLDLGSIRRDVMWYVRSLEEVLIRATTEFGIGAEREEGKTGVWVNAGPGKKDSTPRAPGIPSGEETQKLGAIGVHISRWVTTHGFAYNVSTDLRYFDLIVPCGISGRKATSLEKLLGRAVHLAEVRPRIVRNFGEVFGLEMRETPREALLRLLDPDR